MNNIERNRVLIASMTKSEKRSYQLFCGTQNTDKAYGLLFDLIERSTLEQSRDIGILFAELSGGKNLEIAAAYLYQQLLEFLANNKPGHRIQSKLFRLIEQANVLFDRKLIDEAFEELNEASRLATLYENDILLALILRTEMFYLSSLGFQNLSEKELVNKQMKLLAQMKQSRSISQFIFLTDILNHRLLHKPMSDLHTKRIELNDLVMSELNLISNNHSVSIHAEKLHLLFQSTYSLEVNNYESAVRNYTRLIDMFGENPHLLHEPIYYLSAIDGVLDSLLSMGMYNEMQHFMVKLHELNEAKHTSNFTLKVAWLSYYYQLTICLHTKTATDSVQAEFDYLFKKIIYLPLDIQLQFYLTNALVLLSNGEYKAAYKMIKKILSEGKLFYRLPMFRIVRLTNLIIQAELCDYQFVENEIGALKRNFKTERLSKTELLVFKFVQAYPLPKSDTGRLKLWKSFKRKINLINNDKFERRLLKFFNFVDYIETKLNN